MCILLAIGSVITVLIFYAAYVTAREEWRWWKAGRPVDPHAWDDLITFAILEDELNRWNNQHHHHRRF